MKTVPRTCCHCGSSKIQEHCDNTACTWLRCTECTKLTDISKTPREAE